MKGMFAKLMLVLLLATVTHVAVSKDVVSKTENVSEYGCKAVFTDVAKAPAVVTTDSIFIQKCEIEKECLTFEDSALVDTSHARFRWNSYPVERHYKNRLYSAKLLKSNKDISLIHLDRIKQCLC